MKELREYQRQIVDDVASSDRNLLICLPTGGGKTVIASALMNKIEGLKIFVVPRLELIQQAKDEFGDVDIIWSDKTCLTDKDIIIASKDSLRTQHKLIPQRTPLTLIFDEAHIGIKQTHELISLIPHTRVLGLTATPERMDGLALLKGSDELHKYGVFDELYQKETVPSLVRKGFLAPLKYYARPIDGITKIRPDSQVGEELSDRQIREIFDKNKIWGDLVNCYEEYGKGRPAIGFTTTVALADVVTNIFCEAGYKFHTIHGGMSVNERQELIDKLKSGEIDGLVNAALLTYGFDCPEASYAFSCRHIKSRPLWFQMVGRILRPYKGKECAIFVDHGDSISEFSEPDCALPVMDELIRWRADGESQLQKEARKEKLRKTQDTMRIIQELDPLPSDMVEVTMEDTYDRLIRVITSLKQENSSLKNTLQESARRQERNEQLNAIKIAKLQQEKEYLRQEQERSEQASAKRIAQLQQEKKDLRQEQEHTEQLVAIRIARLKEMAKRPAPRYTDPDKTFEYIKHNYCAKRKILACRFNDSEECHQAVVASFREDEEKLSFCFDARVFERSMAYWHDHYTDHWTPSSTKSSSYTQRPKAKIRKFR